MPLNPFWNKSFSNNSTIYSHALWIQHHEQNIMQFTSQLLDIRHLIYWICCWPISIIHVLVRHRAILFFSPLQHLSQLFSGRCYWKDGFFFWTPLLDHSNPFKRRNRSALHRSSCNTPMQCRSCSMLRLGMSVTRIVPKHRRTPCSQHLSPSPPGTSPQDLVQHWEKLDANSQTWDDSCCCAGHIHGLPHLKELYNPWCCTSPPNLKISG